MAHESVVITNHNARALTQPPPSPACRRFRAHAQACDGAPLSSVQLLVGWWGQDGPPWVGPLATAYGRMVPPGAFIPEDGVPADDADPVDDDDLLVADTAAEERQALSPPTTLTPLPVANEAAAGGSGSGGGGGSSRSSGKTVFRLRMIPRVPRPPSPEQQQQQQQQQQEPPQPAWDSPRSGTSTLRIRAWQTPQTLPLLSPPSSAPRFHAAKGATPPSPAAAAAAAVDLQTGMVYC